MTITARILLLATITSLVSASHVSMNMSVFDMLTSSSDQICYMNSRINRYRDGSQIKKELLDTNDSFIQYALTDKEAIIYAWMEECSKERFKSMYDYRMRN